MTHLYLAYAITELYCAVFAVTIWFRLNYSIGSEYEVRQLRNMIYAYLVMLGTDIVWALYEDGSLHMPRLPYMAVNGTSVMAVACGCYFWFRFIEAREHFGRQVHAHNFPGRIPPREQAGHIAGPAGKVQQRTTVNPVCGKKRAEIIRTLFIFDIICQPVIKLGKNTVAAHFSSSSFLANIFS